MSDELRVRERIAAKADRQLNKLAKWRSFFAGWQLGTRTNDDPESNAVRDQRELLLLLRAEVSALAGLLIKKRVFTAEEWTEFLGDEAEFLDKALAKRYPGFSSTEDGLLLTPEAAETMKRLHFKP